MAAYYYDSGNTADPSRDGSQGHPYLDPSELPTPNRITDTQAEHYFRCGTTTNLSAALRSTALTSVPIIIGSWGTGAKPIITAYEMLDEGDCLEVDVDNSGAVATLTPQGGTNLWRVPKTFFGLFAGEVFGASTDVVDSTGNGAIVPAAEYEWCGAVADTDAITDGYGVVYSVGNPVTTYGGIYVSSFEAGWGSNANERATFGTQLANGGVEITGLDLRKMYWVSRAPSGTTSATYSLALHTYHDNDVLHVYRGFNLNIGDANAPNVSYASVRVFDNYAQNLGNSFFDTSGTLYTTLNDARIYRNVIDGHARAYSTGCFYIAGGARTTDGTRILIKENSVFNGDGGHFWPGDGHAYYQEEYGVNIEFRRNVAANCKLSFIANRGGANIVFSANLGIAPSDVATGQLSSFYNFILVNSSDAYGDHEVFLHGNVAVGYVRFGNYTAATDSFVTYLGNISLGGGAIPGGGEGALYEAIRANTADTAKFRIDGNNFYGHLADLRNSVGGATYNAAPEVNNRITSDPSAELARLPVPTDPTVNYALQIRPGARIVGGVVDLRPGTRVVV